MRSAEPLDFSNTLHRAILFDLASCNQNHLLNDYDNDIILILAAYEQDVAAGRAHAFIVWVDNQPAGCFWLETDHYQTGRVRGALLPEWRHIKNLIYFLKGLVQYGFDSLGLRKLDAEITLYSKHDRGSAATEKVLKRIGFQKVGIIREALVVNGKPKDTVLLDYLKRDYDVKKEK